MRPPLRLFCTLCFLCAFLAASAQAVPQQTAPSNAAGASGQQPGAGPEKPKIRCITAFIKLDVALYPQEVADTVVFLRQARKTYEQAGFEVQTIRITTQPFPGYTEGMNTDDALRFLHAYDELANKDGFNASIGPAMMKAGDDDANAALLARALAPAQSLNGSIIIAGDDGIHWDAVGAAAGVVEFLAAHSAGSLANFRFAATAMVPPGAPFFPASYHLSNGHEFSVGLQSAGVVAAAMSATHDPAEAERRITKMLGDYAQQIENISLVIGKKTGWSYTGIDLSPAPMKQESIGAAIEAFTGVWLGSSGTLTAAGVITRALREIEVEHAGYSGLMLPVMEDNIIARRWSEGSLSIDNLLSYSAVCGTGLDVIPLPGKISREQIERILTDVATLAFKWHKPLSARLLPFTGKDAGDKTNFDDAHLVNVMIRPLP